MARPRLDKEQVRVSYRLSPRTTQQIKILAATDRCTEASVVERAVQALYDNAVIAGKLENLVSQLSELSSLRESQQGYLNEPGAAYMGDKPER